MVNLLEVLRMFNNNLPTYSHENNSLFFHPVTNKLYLKVWVESKICDLCSEIELKEDELNLSAEDLFDVILTELINSEALQDDMEIEGVSLKMKKSIKDKLLACRQEINVIPNKILESR